MADVNLESLNLKKPLEKMTAKELRELAMNNFPQITGASGMDKNELLHAIKDVCGLLEEDSGVSPYKEQIKNIKKKIKDLKSQKMELTSGESKKKDRIRKRIKRLKRQTRRLAGTTA